jgi:hypothetical protein
MSGAQQPRASIEAELRRFRLTGEDHLGRDLEEIRRQRSADLACVDAMNFAIERLDDGDVELGKESGPSQRARLEASRDAFARCAERDRRLLAELMPEEAAPTAAPDYRGAGGTPARISSESRSIAGPQFSSALALSPPVQGLLDHCAGAPEALLEQVRAHAEALPEDELAALFEQAPWRTGQEEHWRRLTGEQRAAWLCEVFAAELAARAGQARNGGSRSNG